jgi:hypothetical protein
MSTHPAAVCYRPCVKLSMQGHSVVRDLAVAYRPSLQLTTRRNLLGADAVAICDSVLTGEGVA